MSEVIMTEGRVDPSELTKQSLVRGVTNFGVEFEGYVVSEPFEDDNGEMCVRLVGTENSTSRHEPRVSSIEYVQEL